MKNLIRKILKEEQDEFEWARGLDVNQAEKEIKKPFVRVEYDFSFDGPELYQMLVDAGIRDIDKLSEIGDFVYSETETVYDNGVDSGRDSCDCDGCCDDYVYYEEADREKEEAREEGREEGRESAQEEIEELKSRIEELESQLNETVNKKNTKRI